MTWYVANLATYVLVHAPTEQEARQQGKKLLPTPPRTVRLASQDEIEFQAWHQQNETEWGKS
jgi:hypothetical protein